MVSSHRIPTIAILCIFIGPIQQIRHLGKEAWEDKESKRKWHRMDSVQSKEWCPSHKFFYVLFSIIQSFLLGFPWNSHIAESKKKTTSKKDPTSISDITISYLYKNIIIPLLCQCGLFIHIYVSKNSFVSKDVIFYLLWYSMMRWSSHKCKKVFSLILWFLSEV